MVIKKVINKISRNNKLHNTYYFSRDMNMIGYIRYKEEKYAKYASIKRIN